MSVATAIEEVLVVIPVHAADATLPSCLESLRQTHDFERLEVVIVRDGESPQGIEEETAAFSVRETVSNKSGNAGAARNLGAESARDGIIVFVDADVIVEEGALSKLIAPILRGEADATVGNYSEDVRGLSFAQAYKQLYISMVYSRRRGEIRNEFWTALGAVRAEAFHRVGGFSARFPGASGEDTELGQRLTAAGYRIHAVPEGRGQHLHQFTCFGLARNDLLKGTHIMLNNFRHKNSLQDNRHTSRADVAAVALAYLFSAASVGGIFWQLFFALALLAFFGWLAARKPMLAFFSRQGPAFLLRSIPLALALDVTRGLCLPLAAWRFFRETK
jgi:GT2 family glycosyltransferase